MNRLFVILENGYQITEPMSLEDLENKFGDVEHLKRAGFEVKEVGAK